MYTGDNRDIPAEHIQSEFCFEKEFDDNQSSAVGVGKDLAKVKVEDEQYQSKEENQVRTDGGVAAEIGSQDKETEDSGYEFDVDPTGQIWWRQGEGTPEYDDKLPDSIIYENEPEKIREEHYLSVEDLARIQIIEESLEETQEEFVEEVYDSEIVPTQKWQIKQALEEPSRYAVKRSDYDGAPKPSESRLEASKQTVREARREYGLTELEVPGTSFDTLFTSEESYEKDGADPKGIIGM